MSLGNTYSKRIRYAEGLLMPIIEELEGMGILVVMSAGNKSADSRDTWTYPAGISRGNTLSVAALDITGSLAEFSNYGPRVDLAAPGAQIVGHVGRTLQVGSTGGTSMAAPYVTAAAAMVWATHPDWTAAQVKEALIATVTPNSLDVGSGGMVNIEEAIQYRH